VRSKRISLKLDSRLARQIKMVAQAEGRSWREQAEWFLEAFADAAEELDSRPISRKCPKNLRQDAQRSLFPPFNLYQRLKAFSETERLTLVELVRQMLWVGVETRQEINLPGIRKEVFQKQYLKGVSPCLRK